MIDNMDRQSVVDKMVVDKMVREISLEVRVNSENLFSNFCRNPDLVVVLFY